LIPNLWHFWFPTDEPELGVLGAGGRGVKETKEGDTT
jgi:hypothetical protein